MTTLPQGDDWKQAHEEDLSEIPGCLCVNCGDTHGKTIMLPTNVPFFREIIIMSFRCQECGFQNSEINFGGEIQERGEKIVMQIATQQDLNRQIIKSDSASLIIPQLDLEIPPATQRGTISTLEGVLRRAADNLETQQPERLRLGDVDNFHRCKGVIDKLRHFAGDEVDQDNDEQKDVQVFPFEVILDDPAGNSFIENPSAPQPDPHMQSTKYFRTATQDMALGLQPAKEAVEAGTIDDANPQYKNVSNVAQGRHSVEIDAAKSVRQEVLKFPTTCPHCYKNAETDMCMTDIPHFKEVIIMSLVCDECGYKSNEIKGGGAIPKYGTKITLKVKSPDDLAREVLKSDTAGLAIPEVDLELEEGGLDGLYTTVEGLLNKVHSRLKTANPFGSGDAAKKQHLSNDGGTFSEPSPNYQRYMKFLQMLKDLADGKRFPFTLEVSDPLSNSFIGPVPKDAIALSLQAEKDDSKECYKSYVDTGMTLDEYERTHDQNEILGLNDIKTENYGGDTGVNYGTDQLEEVPDRIRRLDVRGPDHPLQVGKAPVEGDTTIMGSKSANFAVPSMGLRGKVATAASGDDTHEGAHPPLEKELRSLIHQQEHDDENFRMNDEYDGPVEGMVYKDGAQGVGYYTDVPLHNLWKQQNDN